MYSKTSVLIDYDESCFNNEPQVSTITTANIGDENAEQRVYAP